MRTYRINIIDSLSSWEKIHSSWNELLEKSATPNLFLTWEWLYSWAECFLNEKREIFIICVYDRDEIVGIAPLYIEHIHFIGMALKRLHFMGTPESGSDYLDVIMKKGKENEITNSVYEFLMTDVSERWDCLMLVDLPSTSFFLMYFMRKVGAEGKYVEISRASYCPVTALPGTIEAFFSRLSRNRREQFRRHLKVLQTTGQVSHESHYGNEDEIIEIFFQIYGKNWGENRERLQKFVMNFVSRKQDDNVLQIDLLKFNEVYVAGLLHFRYKKTLFMYLMAVDKNFNSKISTGNILVGLCIQNAINQRMSTYDFLKGEESYKFHWATHGNISTNMFFFQKKLVPVMFALNRLLKHAGKLILR